jgi:hypothetical protein
MTSAETNDTPFTPVTRDATERAYRRIIGGQQTDPQRYGRYQQQVALQHDNLWSAVQLLGDTYVRASRIIRAVEPVQMNAYIGGALIYLASREEQAELDRRPLPAQLIGELGRAAIGQLLLGDVSPDQMGDVLTWYSQEIPEQDLQNIANSTLRDVLAVNARILRTHQASFDASPDVDIVTAKITNISMISMISAAKRAAAFPYQEEDFCGFMTEKWWHNTPPVVTLSQLTGAADTRALMQISAQAAS